MVSVLRAIGSTLACLLLLLVSRIATAQESAPRALQQAQSLYDEADFEGALRALETASRSTGLTNADVARFLELRALVHLGLGQREQATSDVRALRSAHAGYRPPESAPPALRRLFSQMNRDEVAAIEIELNATSEIGVLHINVSLRGDAENLGREVRVYTRNEGQARYQSHVGTSTDVRSSAPSVDVYAELIGPGGAVLVSSSSAAAPQNFAMPQAAAEEVVVPPAGGGDTVLIALLIAGGVALVAGGVIVAVVVVGQGAPDTQLSPPMLEQALTQSPMAFRF